MLEPSEVKAPFGTDDERAEAIVRLFELDRELQRWLSLARESEHLLSSDVRALLARQPLEPGDSPEVRLRRWASVFREEIDTIHDARSRLVHGIRTSDADIRGANWLGAHLVGLLRGPDSASRSAI
jgi:hypothetical protein